MSACRPLSELAPTVEMIQASHVNIASVAQLERGRMIYIKDCSDCHSVLPIHDYTLEEWHVELPDMIEETKLNPQQAADVEAYVLAALKTEPVDSTKKK